MENPSKVIISPKIKDKNSPQEFFSLTHILVLLKFDIVNFSFSSLWLEYNFSSLFIFDLIIFIFSKAQKSNSILKWNFKSKTCVLL